MNDERILILLSVAVVLDDDEPALLVLVDQDY